MNMIGHQVVPTTSVKALSGTVLQFKYCGNISTFLKISRPDNQEENALFAHFIPGQVPMLENHRGHEDNAVLWTEAVVVPTSYDGCQTPYDAPAGSLLIDGDDKFLVIGQSHTRGVTHVDVATGLIVSVDNMLNRLFVVCNAWSIYPAPAEDFTTVTPLARWDQRSVPAAGAVA